MGPIEDYKTTQDELAAKLDKQKKRYIRCPKCGTVFKDAFSLILCEYCGYTRDDYRLEGRTLFKKKL